MDPRHAPAAGEPPLRVAVIVGGGEGERLGREGGKQLAVVAGRPVLSHTIAAFERCAAIDAIVVVVHPDRIEEYTERAVAPLDPRKVVAVVGGGDSRERSVRNGLEAVPPGATVIAVQDGARPLITPQVIAQAVAALEADTALAGVVVGHPAYDTLKIVEPGGLITSTPDRSQYWVAQTPQVFRAHKLREAYERAAADGFSGTDDAAIVEHLGGRVRMVAGARDNIKVTVPEDLLVVERILQERAEGSQRG